MPTTILELPGGGVLRRSWSTDGELIASECRVCRELVPKAKLVGAQGGRRKWLCRACQRARPRTPVAEGTTAA